MSKVRQQTFHTSFSECVLWSAKMLTGVAAAALLVLLLRGVLRHRTSSLAPHFIIGALGLILGGVLVLGTALFFFGWLGRVTVTLEGLKAPRYSGFQQFMSWAAIRSVKPGSLNGWPCIIVSGDSTAGGASIYLMVIGKRKIELANYICECAGSENPLVLYLEKHGV